MATEASIFKSDKEKADDLIAQFELPPEVQSISTADGVDESGDPALFIHLHLTKNAVQQRSDVKKLNEFSEQIQILLMGNGVAGFPYVYLDEAA